MSSYRSSSQVSVYNYPEHLNPFYEDEQHKRLRFWKIKKSSNSNKNRDGSSGMRRGSFNFGSLRDLFSMGSFRTKKQSSTLGINTTSESPPPLRRDFISYNKEDEDKYASYDPHFRNTLDTNTFQRNTVYRTSLQNMNNAPNDLTFNRNNRYRSTIQNGASLQHISTLRNDGRYMYPSSITSTPKSRYLTDYTPRMTPGSSMNSISTNPFDDDYDDDNDENVEGIITSNNLTQTENSMSSSTKKPARKKKRRAPPPPNVAIPKSTSESENIQIRINENGDTKNGLDELSRLTAEFESFVKSSQDDTHQQQQTKLIIDEDEIITKHDNAHEKKAENQEIMTVETSQSRHVEKEETPQVSVDVGRTISLNVEKIQSPSTTENVERITEHHVIVRDEIESVDKTIAIIQEDLKIKEIELKIKEDELKIKEALEEVNNNKTSQIEKVVEIREAEKSKSRELSPDIQTLEVHQITTEIRKFPEYQRITPTPTPSREETPDFIPVPVREKFDVLRIEENENDYKKPEDIKEEKSIVNVQVQETEVIKPKEKSLPPPIKIQRDIQPIQIKVISPTPPIKEPRLSRDRTPIPLARTEVESQLSMQGFVKVDKPVKYDEFEKCVVYRQSSQNDDEVVLRNEDQPPKVPERRRSVKDIIESINRSQQLLKINQPPSPQLPRKKYNYGEQKFSYHEKPAIAPKDNVLLKLQRQAESERRINALLDDLQDFSKENADIRRSHKFPVSERDTNNNSTSFPHERLSRDDINPIPKPRRVINLVLIPRFKKSKQNKLLITNFKNLIKSAKMSNIYIQEPPSNGKVLLKTTVGEIEIELWSKEAPKTCRNFVQLCLDGFYNGTIFHRLVKSFIVQGGENSEQADLIEPIKNEFHSRLRFSRRGLCGMATNEGSDNNMQFFFTLDQTPELQNTHTIFGKVTGDTIYNMIKLNDSQTDHNDRVIYPHKINKVKILNNPFPDLKPRFDKIASSKDESSENKKKSKKEGVKNFKLISFGEEAEQDEIEVVTTKSKKIDQPSTTSWKKDKPEKESRKRSRTPEKKSKRSRTPEKDSKRSRTPPLPKQKTPPPKPKEPEKVVEYEEDSDSDFEESMKKQKMSELEKKRKEIQDQIKDLKKQYHSDRKDKTKEKQEEAPKPENNAIQSYLDEKEKYKSCKVKAKGSSREAQTLALLEKFKQKLHSAAPTKSNDNDNSDDENWLGHKLDFSESADAVLARDASKKADDWYDIYDPRNPLNKRKRGETSKHESNKKMK
ncbi:uncharacterized protein [Chironomus tepperi]|uniref:uncharacterized protein n=1 Tax=Chironomus tepperi TaxID=113505 RepID=UPI00391F4EC5